MSINKITYPAIPTVDKDGETRVEVRSFYAQREGETGLSQVVDMHFMGWEEAEVRAFVDWLKDEANNYLNKQHRTW